MFSIWYAIQLDRCSATNLTIVLGVCMHIVTIYKHKYSHMHTHWGLFLNVFSLRHLISWATNGSVILLDTGQTWRDVCTTNICIWIYTDKWTANGHIFMLNRTTKFLRNWFFDFNSIHDRFIFFEGRSRYGERNVSSDIWNSRKQQH